MQMPGKAVVDQHRLSGLAKQDVRRLDVEMNDVLPVQVRERHGDPASERNHFLGRSRQVVQHRIERLAGQPLEDDVRLGGEVAIGDEAWHMPAGEPGQDHLLHLEADDHGRVRAGPHLRHLHQHWKIIIRMGDAEELRHAAPMREFADREAVDHVARVYSGFRHSPVPSVISPGRASTPVRREAPRP